MNILYNLHAPCGREIDARKRSSSEKGLCDMTHRERERDGGRLARRKPKAKWPCPIVVVAGQMCRNRETLSLAAVVWFRHDGWRMPGVGGWEWKERKDSSCLFRSMAFDSPFSGCSSVSVYLFLLLYSYHYYLYFFEIILYLKCGFKMGNYRFFSCDYFLRWQKIVLSTFCAAN